MAVAADERLAVRVPKELAERFRAQASRRRERPSVALRRLIVSEVGGLDEPTSKPEPTSRAGRRPRLVATYVTSADHELIQKAAAPYGGVAAWLRGAIEARLGRASELPAREETQALYAATSELWAVGRNLNQIARAFNEAKKGGMPAPTFLVNPNLIVQLARVVDAVADQATAVIERAKRRGFGRGE